MTADAFVEETSIDVVVVDDEALVSAHGELDLFSVARLRVCLDEAADLDRVIVDMAGVTFVDSSVLRCLQAAALDRATTGRTLRVDNAVGIVRRLMDLLRLDGLRAA